jgi:hypothetical protein
MAPHEASDKVSATVQQLQAATLEWVDNGIRLADA